MAGEDDLVRHLVEDRKHLDLVAVLDQETQSGRGRDIAHRREGRIRIVRASGEMVGPRRLWFDPKVERGDIVYVPVEPEGGDFNWSQFFKDNTTTLVNVVTAAFIIAKVAD